MSLIAQAAIGNAGYILYFDDFRHEVPDAIDITAKPVRSEWINILANLFKKACDGLRLSQLLTMEERQRRSAVARAQKYLNETLTRQWQHFQLDRNDSLQIHLRYETPAEDRHTVIFDVVEYDSDGEEHYFYIKDRSKGFFWFFNFVMRLEFNAKSQFHYPQAVYLLDEPGSYLHASAQAKLCKKLRDLSTGNAVIFSTHSHHLLDPTVIPFGSIRVAEKDEDGNVALRSVFEHDEDSASRRLAFQPILDALQVSPTVYQPGQNLTLIVEGLYDFFAFDMLKGERLLTILPGVDAGSVRYLISLMLGCGARYSALWDNDTAGRTSMKKAASAFGRPEASARFFVLPLVGRARKRILQDLFDGTDVAMIKSELELPANAGFKKAILAMYYSDRRDQLIAKLTDRTRQHFDAVFKMIGADP